MIALVIYAAVAVAAFLAYTAFIKCNAGRPDYAAITVASVAWPVSAALLVLLFVGVAAVNHLLK